MTLLRFYLLALKGAGFLNLRLERLDEARALLSKLAELDTAERLGARPLLDLIDTRTSAAAGV